MKRLAGECTRDLSQEELDRIWLLCGAGLGGGRSLKRLSCLSPSTPYSLTPLCETWMRVGAGDR